MDNHLYTNELHRQSVEYIQALQGKLAGLLAQREYTQEQLRQMVRCSQEAAVECRALYRRHTLAGTAAEELARLAETGYRLERKSSGSVRIELPLLLPKRGGDSSFILTPLNELLSLHAGQLPRLKECTVIFRYIYGEHHRIADIRDHDNVENRAVLNVIERYLLVSDSGYYCTNIQQTAFGSSDKTIILLFPGRIGVDPLPDEVLT